MKKLALILAVLLLLSGCGSTVGDDLFRLPKPPKDFLKLQEKIDVLISGGGEYSPPVSGNFRQAQQTIDLTGNGVTEALVFMRFSGEKALRIYIYQLDNNDYKEMDIVSEDAENIDSIDYQDIDGDGLPEILVGWEVGNGTLKALSVYKLVDDHMVEVLSTNYTELIVFDIRNIGQNDILVLRHDEANFSGSVQPYYFENGEMLSYQPALMSKGVQAIRRIKSGFLKGGHPALYVASKLEQNTILTDIFTVRDGHFFNVSLNPETEISDETIRNTRVYASDVDLDGVIELPQVSPLPGYENTSENIDYWYIKWRDYDAYGRINYKMTTYHSHNDGWFVRLPDDWIERFTVTSRIVSNTINSTTLAYINDFGMPIDVCVIYTLTSDNRATQATEDGRFYLGEKTDAVFAARILPNSEKVYPIAQEKLLDMFKLINNKWITGEVEE